MNMMNYKEFVKFGYQSKIVPVLAASEDVVQTFRHIMGVSPGNSKPPPTPTTVLIDALNQQEFLSNRLYS